MAQDEHKEQRLRFTGLVAWKVAGIVARELDLANSDAC